MRRRISGVLVVSAVLALWYGWPQQPTQHESYSPQAEGDTPYMADMPTVSVPSPEPSHRPPTPSMSYQQCQSFLSRYARAQSDYWQEWSMHSLAAPNANSHDIALALFHLRGSSAAASYMLMIMRRDAQLNRINQRLQQQASAQLQAGSRAVTLAREVPHSRLQQAFFSGDWDQVPVEGTLLVDDLAWLIQQKSVSDDVITRLLGHVEDINATLGNYPGSPPFLHLIDVAARSGRVALTAYLLDKGALLSSHPLLPSTLDASLAYLSMALRLRDKTSDVALLRLIDLIKRLLGMGQQAGFIQRQDGSIVASFHARSSYFYDGPLQQTLARDYGFYIDSVPHVDVSDTAAATAIRAQINEDWQHYAAQLLGDQPESKARACIALQQAMWDVWDLTFVNVANVSVDNVEQQLADWYQQSPILTSCYRNHIDRRIQQAGRSVEDERLIFIAAANNDMAQIVTLFKQYPDAAQRWFYELILYRPRLYSSLQAVGYVPYSLTYSLLVPGYSADIVQTFVTLHNQGFDLSRVDTYRRSLLYVAVRTLNIDLLRFFVQQNVPYYTEELLPDPLYLWLWSAAMEDRIDNTSEAVTLLMEEYTPPVNDHHRRLMAAIERKNPALYEQLAAAFPSLSKGSMHAPEVVCAY